MCIVNRLGAHKARPSCVGSCRMTLRVLFAGALTALPLIVSGALAQTAPAPACRHDLPGAVSQSGKSARLDDVCRAICADSGESACRSG